MNVVDPGFIDLLDIELTAGRNFSEEQGADYRTIIVNEALVADYGWDNPIGKKLPGPGFDDHEVIGVMKDFNYQSLRSDVSPLAIAPDAAVLFSGIQNINFGSTLGPRIMVKIASNDMPATMAKIEVAWATADPETSFDYYFLDSNIDARYRQEAQLSTMVSTGSGLAVLISCLGLFALAALAVTRRTKEIGIRKALGASASGIATLVTTDFLKLIVISFVIATPLAWYSGSEWLTEFAFRTNIGAGVLLISGAMALLLGMITVGYQSYKASRINPAVTLRNE